jgi:hypothetical protein
MATILIKRGRQADLDNLTLEEGEIALAYNEDKSAIALYAGAGNGSKVLVNPDVSGDITGMLSQAKGYTDTQISQLVNGAPEAMDTLKEISDAISENSEIMDALNAAIGEKVDKVSGKGLSTEDYTVAEKTKLAGVAAGANNYTHPSSHAASMITQDASHRFVSDTEKTTWNNKLSSSSIIDGGTF